jgi:ubiquinone biosynthesis monooxygenase Coq7
MAAQEQRHLDRFDRLVSQRRVRPTALQPLWNVAGFALGAATALMSEKAALACTDAIETEIDRHYGAQLDELGEDDPELASTVAEFRADELEHRDIAREAGAPTAIGYPLLTGAIRAGCRVAIALSKRI